MAVVSGVERMYDARQFPRTLGTRNNFSCFVFRKEKNREFPRSPWMEKHQPAYGL